jgi:hypothetical protein
MHSTNFVSPSGLDTTEAIASFDVKDLARVIKASATSMAVKRVRQLRSPAVPPTIDTDLCGMADI